MRPRPTDNGGYADITEDGSGDTTAWQMQIRGVTAAAASYVAG